MSKKLHVAIGLIIAVGALYWAFHGVDFAQLGYEIARVDHEWLPPALACFFIAAVFRAERWRLLLLPLRSLQRWRVLRYVCIGYAANDVLPARAGELLRPILMRRHEDMPALPVLSSIALEKVMDVGSILVIASVALAITPAIAPDGLQPVLQVGGLVFVPLLVMVIFASVRFGHRLEPLAKRINLLDRVSTGLRALRRVDLTAYSFLAGTVAWVLELGMYYCVARSFDLPVDLGVLAVLLVVVNLGTLIPSSPGYVGTFEALSILVLAPFVGKDLAMAYTLVLHALLNIPIIVVGGLWWLQIEILARKKALVSYSRECHPL